MTTTHMWLQGVQTRGRHTTKYVFTDEQRHRPGGSVGQTTAPAPSAAHLRCKPRTFDTVSEPSDCRTASGLEPIRTCIQGLAPARST
eukprot:366381-Chlamydomonas_euryale.AAC.15